MSANQRASAGERVCPRRCVCTGGIIMDGHVHHVAYFLHLLRNPGIESVFAKGGADPVPIVERWEGMVRYVHMKDLSPEWQRMRREGVPLRSPEGYTEMGQGIIDFRRLLPILDEVNYSGWLMAELDEAKRPPREAATLSKRYIEHTLGLALRQPAAPASSAA